MDDMDHTPLSPSDGADTPESLGASSSQAPEPLTLGRGACEACRTRKTRCDKESPCHQCRRANIQCLYPAVRHREKRTRILLTPQYERKIDFIEHRLDDITTLLHDIKTHTAITRGTGDVGSEAPRPNAALQSVSSPGVQSLLSEPARTTVVEGESSLSAHSVFVNDFLRNFIGAKPTDPEIEVTMGTLSHIADVSNKKLQAGESVLPNARVPKSEDQTKSSLPPIESAVTLIRKAEAQHLAGTGWVYEYVTMQSFGDLCLTVYFSGETSPFDFISVNAGLFSLFSDHASTASISRDEKQRNLAYARFCRDNLETGLARIPLHLPTSASVIAALLFGAFYSIEFSASSLSWSLSSKASELCQTLGYHRKSPRGNRHSAKPKFVEFLFWKTSFVDKSLSLRLGRTSTIQDWDITTNEPSPPSDDEPPVLAFYVLWTKTAKCQGNIYEMLYAPASMTQPDEVRQARVNSLASSLHAIAQETEKTRSKWLGLAKQQSGDNLLDFFAISDEILRLSLLTHVFRAAPSDVRPHVTFNINCVEAARATLDRHHDCMAVIHRSNGIYFSAYINWTLLFAPFVPYIVLFCHVMETRDQADSARLNAFASSIQAATDVSEPAAKMYRLFQVLNKIAARYIELGLRDNAEAPSTTAMDAQLSALGFPRAGMPGAYSETQPSIDEFSLDQRYLDPVLWAGDEMQLENWFYNNQESMELLESVDLSSL